MLEGPDDLGKLALREGHQEVKQQGAEICARALSGCQTGCSHLQVDAAAVIGIRVPLEVALFYQGVNDATHGGVAYIEPAGQLTAELRFAGQRIEYPDLRLAQ